MRYERAAGLDVRTGCDANCYARKDVLYEGNGESDNDWVLEPCDLHTRVFSRNV